MNHVTESVTEDQMPFSLRLQSDRPLRQKLFDLVQRPLERMLSLDRLNALYAAVQVRHPAESFCQGVLDVLNVSVRMEQADLDRIPRTGPVVVVANHPFGALDGIILACMLKRVRPDVKIMANFLLERIPELRELFFFVDPFGGSQSVRRSMRGLRDSMQWIEKGGLLATFPAGEVAHFDMRQRAVVESPWNSSIVRLIRRSQAPVVPVFFNGANGKLFHMAGLVHPSLRTAMLPNEVFNKRNQTIEARIGRPIAWKQLSGFSTDEEMAGYLRLRTHMLANRAASRSVQQVDGAKLGIEKVALAPVLAEIHDRALVAGQPSLRSCTPGPTRRDELRAGAQLSDIVSGESAEVLSAELARLPDACRLVRTEEYTVFQTTSHQTPHMLREIGRLREITFRQTGEGTGKEIDLDEFDAHYRHLFVWNHRKCELVGAYRMGLSKPIMRYMGKAGFYTYTLFDYKTQLLEQMGPSIELGRSFIRDEYQRSFQPLLLLWKGIGAFVCANPEYKVLFGPVSINADYQSMSRQIMVQFMRASLFVPGLARLVRPRTPFRERRVANCEMLTRVVKDIDNVTELVNEIERDQRGVPILLKQYLRMGGKVLGFNIDPEFSDVLDALVMVDLRQTNRRMLGRYLTETGMKQFLEYHQTPLDLPEEPALVEV